MFSFSFVRTFERVKRVITDNIPSTLGALHHISRWIFSGISNITHINSRFNPEDLPPGILKNGVKIFFVPGTADKVSSGVVLGEYLKGILFNDLTEEAEDEINASDLKDILSFLSKAVSSIHLLSFSEVSAGAGIEDFAKHLEEQIQASGAEQIFVIGHSRGGLVNTYFIENLLPKLQETRKAQGQRPLNVLGACHICSPFGGSYLAIKLFSWIATSIKQMMPGSDFLKNLCAQVLQSSIKYYFIGAEKDYIVPVGSSYIQELAERCVVFEKEGHLSIMSSPRMFEHVLKCLLESCQNLNGLTPEETLSLSLSISHPFSSSLTNSLTDSLSQSLSKSFANYSESISKNNDVLDEDAVVVNKVPVALWDVYYELDVAIILLKNTYHLKSAEEKVQVLEMLRENLREILTQHKKSHYSTCNTIKNFINAFLDDNELFPGRTAREILNEPLNYPVYLYSYLSDIFKPIIALPAIPKPDSQVFIEELIERYADVELLSPPSPTLEIEVTTTTQYSEQRLNL